MGFAIDIKTRKITLPVGDTGGFTVRMIGELFDFFADGDLVSFAISNKLGEDVLKKFFSIEDNACRIRLSSADTADISPGSYTWNLRFFRNVELVDGEPVIENEDDVLTLYNKPPAIVLVDGGCDV